MKTKILLLSAILVLASVLLIACRNTTGPDENKLNVESRYAGSASVPKGEYGLYLASNVVGQPDGVSDYLFVPYRSGEITKGGMYAMLYTIDPLVLSKFQFNVPSDAVIKKVTVNLWGYAEGGGQITTWASLLSGQDTVASTTATNMADSSSSTSITFASSSLYSISPAIINNNSLGLRLVVNSPMHVDAVEIKITSE